MRERILVTLTRDELRHAAHAGIERRLDAMQKGRNGRFREPEWKQRWFQSTVVGAIGELAVAKAFGQDWNPYVGRVDQADVAGLEVRTSELPDPRVKLYPRDNRAASYVLCSYKADQVLIQGWLPGYEIERLGREEFQDGVYTATLAELYAIADLPGEIEYCDTVQLYKGHR